MPTQLLLRSVEECLDTGAFLEAQRERGEAVERALERVKRARTDPREQVEATHDPTVKPLVDAVRSYLAAAAAFESSSGDAPGQRFVPAVCWPAEFLLTCDAQQVYLQLATQASKFIGLFKMDSLGTPSQWGLTLNLKPGTYRYRYYADCGRVTTNVYPGEVEDTPRPMDGLDAVLCVPTHVNSGIGDSALWRVRPRVTEKFAPNQERLTQDSCL